MVKTPVHEIIATLLDLLNTPSPTGRAERAIQYIERHMSDLNVTYERTNKGGLTVILPGSDPSVGRVLTAHVDTLGAMVKEIKDNGRLKLSKIGGFSWHSVDGEYCTVETQDRTVDLRDDSRHPHIGSRLRRRQKAKKVDGQYGSAPRSQSQNGR